MLFRRVARVPSERVRAFDCRQQERECAAGRYGVCDSNGLLDRAVCRARASQAAEADGVARPQVRGGDDGGEVCVADLVNNAIPEDARGEGVPERVGPVAGARYRLPPPAAQRGPGGGRGGGAAGGRPGGARPAVPPDTPPPPRRVGRARHPPGQAWEWWRAGTGGGCTRFVRTARVTNCAYTSGGSAWSTQADHRAAGPPTIRTSALLGPELTGVTSAVMAALSVRLGSAWPNGGLCQIPTKVDSLPVRCLWDSTSSGTPSMP